MNAAEKEAPSTSRGLSAARAGTIPPLATTNPFRLVLIALSDVPFQNARLIPNWKIADESSCLFASDR